MYALTAAMTIVLRLGNSIDPESRTSCSASVVALHLACQTLRTGGSKQAIVGGSNVILGREIMISMSSQNL